MPIATGRPAARSVGSIARIDGADTNRTPMLRRSPGASMIRPGTFHGRPAPGVAMAAEATIARVAVYGIGRRSPLSRRMSRVPVSWSMMPAAMKSDALKTAWFMMWKIASTMASGVPS